MKVNKEAPSSLLRTWLRGPTGGVLLNQEVMWVQESLLGSSSGEGGGQRRERKTMKLKAEWSAQPQPRYLISKPETLDKDSMAVSWNTT